MLAADSKIAFPLATYARRGNRKQILSGAGLAWADVWPLLVIGAFSIPIGLLVFRSGDDHTQILMYRNGAARVAVVDVFSIRGPIDVNAYWPGRTFRRVKIRGHDASLVVASPAAPEDGVRVVSWQERSDLGVHLAVSGPMADETLLAIANSIDPRSSLPSASPTPSWP